MERQQGDGDVTEHAESRIARKGLQEEMEHVDAAPLRCPGQCPVTVARTQDCRRASPGKTGKPPKLPLLAWNGGGWSLAGLSESLCLPNELQHFMTLTRALENVLVRLGPSSKLRLQECCWWAPQYLALNTTMM